LSGIPIAPGDGVDEFDTFQDRKSVV
jgi:hypothetical protein